MLALFLSIAVHELGHLWPGLALGQRFVLYGVGPLLVEAVPGGRVRLRWNREVSLYGGIAATLPDRVGRVRENMATIVAGGPVASLMLAVATAGMLAWLPLPRGPLRTELQWLRLLSAALFVGSAVPLANGPFVTDGKQFLRLLDRGPLGVAHRAAWIARVRGSVSGTGTNAQYAFASLNTRATVRKSIRTSNHSDQFCT